MKTDALPGNAPLSEDLLIGATALSAWLGVSERQVFYMNEKKQLPLFKIAGKLAGRKSTLTEHVARLEREAQGA
jgi:hypothetical protein